MNNNVINAELSQRCVADGNALAWQPSPSTLMHRRLLERDGGTIARANSIVRDDAGAKFDFHARWSTNRLCAHLPKSR